MSPSPWEGSARLCRPCLPLAQSLPDPEEAAGSSRLPLPPLQVRTLRPGERQAHLLVTQPGNHRKLKMGPCSLFQTVFSNVACLTRSLCLPGTGCRAGLSCSPCRGHTARKRRGRHPEPVRRAHCSGRCPFSWARDAECPASLIHRHLSLPVLWSLRAERTSLPPPPPHCSDRKTEAQSRQISQPDVF